MKEQMKFVRKLPEPIEVQQEIPLRAPYRKLKAERDQAIEDIMTGKDDFFSSSAPARQTMSLPSSTTARALRKSLTK